MSTEHANLAIFTNARYTYSRGIVDKHAPLITKEITVCQNSPWYSEELREAKRDRRNWRRTKLTIHHGMNEDCGSDPKQLANHFCDFLLGTIDKIRDALPSTRNRSYTFSADVSFGGNTL